MIEYICVNENIVEIDRDKIAEIDHDKPKKARMALHMVELVQQKEKRKARAAKARRHNTMLLTKATTATALFVAAGIAPFSPGYEPKYAGGLIATLIMCGGWLVLFAYANNTMRIERQQERREKEKSARKGRPISSDDKKDCK